MLCRLENATGGQSLPTGTLTPLEFTTIKINAIGAQLGTTSPWTQIPVFFEATYMITASVGLDSGTTGQRDLIIQAYTNGSWYNVGITYAGAGGTAPGIKTLTASAVTRLTPEFSEAIRVCVWHNQGTAITTAAAGSSTAMPVTSLSIAPVYIST
jgi:hypothetical protein